MIVDRIESYLAGQRAKVDDAILDASMRGIRASFVRNLTDATREKREGLHASSKWVCARRMIYDLEEMEPEALTARARVTFMLGDVWETAVLFLARQSGVPILTPGLDGRQERHILTVEGATISGSIDLVVRDDAGAEIPVDCKSMNSRSFGEFKDAVANPAAPWWDKQRWDYLTQLRFYMIAKKAPYGMFVGVCKDTGHMAELHVMPDPTWEGEFRARCKYLMESIAKRSRDGTFLPPRPAFATAKVLPGANVLPDGSKGPCEEVESWRCGYCPHVKTCWEGFDLVPLSSGPKWRKPVRVEAKASG